MPQKRILTIQDLSCAGRCSITVALPVLSACGIETVVLPTAVLSTHTGGFHDIHRADLTEDMLENARRWKDLDLHFDGIYVGFLANEKQIESAITIIDWFRDQDTQVFVDPAMADEGEMYNSLPADHPRHMKELCACADWFKPNITEACMLLGRDYDPGPFDSSFIDDTLDALHEINRGNVIMTGVSRSTSEVGVAAIHFREGAEGPEYYYHYDDRKPGMFYGTGDLFMSSFAGCMVRGLDFSDALDTADRFTEESVERTAATAQDRRFGVNFEEGLGSFADMVSLAVKTGGK